MLLTIHNLPASTGYSDIKSLIQANCGLTKIILDDLVSEGRTKKVTIGLAEEGDAAILVRKINGLYYEGQQLYVEDIRQKKASDQPYRTSQDEYINIGGYPPQLQQGFPPMNMTPQFNYQFPNPYQGNGQAQQGSNRYQDGVMPLMMQNPMMGQFPMGYYMPQMQNSYMDYAKQSQATTDASQYSTYNNQQAQNIAQSSESNENPKRESIRNKEKSSETKQYYNTSYQDDQMAKSHEYVKQGERQDRSSRWDNEKRTNYDNSYRSRSPHRNEGYSQDDNLYDPYQDEESGGSSRPYDDYQRRESPRNSPRENYDSGFVAPEPYRPPEPPQTWQGSRGQANERSDQRYNSSNNDYYRKQPHARSQQQASDNFRSQNNRDYRNVAPPANINSPERNWDDRRNPVENRPQNFDKSWKIKGYQSRIKPKHSLNTWGNREQGPSKPQTSWNKRESIPVPNKSHPHNSWTKRNSAPGPSYSLPQKNWDKKRPKTDNRKQGEIKRMINQDTSWRLQAAALIGKEIWSNRTIPEKLNPNYVLKQIKAAVHSRIVMLLQDEIGVLQDDIVKRYRKKFAHSDDKNLGDAVIQKILDDPEPPPRALNKEKNDSDVAVKAEGDSKQTQEPKKPQKATVPKPAPKPVPPPGYSQLPKYPQGDRKSYSAQKHLQRLEYAEEDLYPLDPVTRDALEKEVEDLCALYNGELNDPEDEQETIVCDRMRGEGLEDFKKVIKLNVTKRILDICTHLTLRVYVIGKIPKVAEIRECLAKLGVISLKKSDTKKAFYIANCETYEDYDGLCSIENMSMNENTTLRFKALHLTGPPKKLTKAQIEANRRKFINSQIENFSSKENEDFQFTENDELYKSEDIMDNVEHETDIEGEHDKDVEGEPEKDVEGEHENNVEGEHENNVEGGEPEKDVEGEHEKDIEGGEQMDEDPNQVKEEDFEDY